MVILLIVFEVGCGLKADIQSLLNPTPIEVLDKPPVTNSTTSSNVVISGVCMADLISFEILQPEPAQTVLCNNGRWTASLDVTGNPDGSLEVVTDQVDPRNDKTISFIIKKDTVPPVVTTAILDSGATLTNKSQISYQVVGSEIAKAYITEDNTCATGGSWQATSGLVAVSSGDGLKGFYVKAQDLAGNVSSCVLVSTIYLDQTPPVVTGLSDDMVLKSSKSWTWSCADANAPCEYRHQISSSVALAPVGTYGLTQSATKSGDGLFYINVQAKDAAGNESLVKSVQVTLSSALPSLAIENNATVHNSNSVSLQLSNVGDFDEIDISNSAACAAPTTFGTGSAVAWNLTAGDGLKTIYYLFRNTSSGLVTGCTSSSITIDTVVPTLALSTGANDPFLTTNFSVTAAFSEPVTGFALSDITVTNGVASGLSGSGSSYSFVVTPSGQGLVTVSVGAGVTVDVAGNGNIAATDLTRTYDSVRPSVSLSSAAAAIFNSASISVTATFSESVTGFALADIVVTNGVASGLAGSGANYTFTVTPSGQGLVTVAVAADIAADAAGNLNTAATDLSRTYDGVAPTITGLSNDATWLKTKTWNWGCDESCTYRFVVDTISNTTPTGSFVATTTTTQNTGSGIYYLHVQAQDSAGNLSLIHVSANLDNTVPTSPASVVDQVALSSLTASPVITFTSGSDAHSGLNKHQARVLKVSDSSAVSSWVDFTSGATLSGLSLVTNTSYKVEVVAIDNAGNISAAGVSDGWVADTTAPGTATSLTLGAVPASATTSPALSWTAASDGAGGSGIQYYEASVFRTSDNAVMGAGWTTLSSGGSISGLTLVDGVQYYFKVRARDVAGNLGSDSVASASWTANANPCSGTPAAGTVCPGGALFVGSYNGSKYMTTPGGCNDSATPTCPDSIDTVTKAFGVNGTATGRTSAVTGSANSSFLATNYADTHAAKYCENMTFGGYSDWFLPALNELALLATNRASFAGLAASPYWTSTESTEYGTPANDQWTIWMDNAQQSSATKTLVGGYVRCMRKY